MNTQQLDRLALVELAVDELGSWIDATDGDAEMRMACKKLSNWLHASLVRQQGAQEWRDRALAVRKHLNGLYPLDQYEPLNR